jgi:hypothetical protein
MAQQQGSGQGRPSGGNSQTTGDSDSPVTLEQLAAKSATTSPKLNIGGNRQPMPDAPLPPGMTPAGGSQAGSGSATGQGTAGNGAAPPSSQAGTGQVNMAPSRLNAGALGAAPPAAMAAAATGKAFVPPPEGSGLTAKLAPAMQLLKSADLATTVREPAHLPQQVAALKAVFRELPGALLSVEKELRDFAADPRAIADIPLQELESLLAKAVGKHAGTVLDAQDEGLLRQLFEDLRKVMTAASGSLHETLGHLHAREQITQSTNVMCLPLALPGPPPRPVELLVEPDPDDEQRRRQGGSPTHMRLSIDTHHMGRVGIDLVSWQEKLTIKLQVSDPKVQSLIANHLEQLDKALARNGFVTPDLSVAVAPAEQRASMLLPERKYTRSLRRIEGII